MSTSTIRSLVFAGTMAVVASSGVAHADTFFLNYEAPGVQNTTAAFTTVGVETFDSRTSLTAFTTDFGTGGAISASYSPTLIYSADQYGGAGGTGQYAAAFGGYAYSLKFTVDPKVFPDGVNYFGYWLSALNDANQVAFYLNGVQVGALTPGEVTTAVGGNPAYFGNPNDPFKHRNSGEPYVFVNFYDITGSFDEVRFTEIPARGGYESDNHTVGFFTDFGGAAVPEPQSWAMMIMGVGLIGGALRRRRQPATGRFAFA